MKKALVNILVAFVLIVSLQAQNSFFYQSTLRNTDGVVVANKSLNIRFSILNGDNIAYSETHTTQTDINGYFSLYVGEGIPESGEFAKIDWSKGNYRLKAEIGEDSEYTLSSEQELLSVPYAIQAEVAGGIQQKAPNGNTWNIMADNDGNPVTVPAGYKLVFNDEFNAMGLPDNTKWNYEEGWVRNGENQYYTVAREENCYQKDGCLHLVCENKSALIQNAKVNIPWKSEWKERRKDTIVTTKSASITTKGIRAWTYCRVDMRAKLPMCKGTWPAIWMMPVDEGRYRGWPNCGEIDIMEHVGYDPNYVHFTLHCAKYNSQHWPNPYNKTVTCETSYKEFHVYSLEWTESRISWYLDGRLRFYVNIPDRPDDLEDEKPDPNWPFDVDFYLILNQAFGGGWGGSQGVDINGLPQDYQIDYVRVYQKK